MTPCLVSFSQNPDTSEMVPPKSNSGSEVTKILLEDKKPTVGDSVA